MMKRPLYAIKLPISKLCRALLLLCLLKISALGWIVLSGTDIPPAPELTAELGTAPGDARENAAPDKGWQARGIPAVSSGNTESIAGRDATAPHLRITEPGTGERSETIPAADRMREARPAKDILLALEGEEMMPPSDITALYLGKKIPASPQEQNTAKERQGADARTMALPPMTAEGEPVNATPENAAVADALLHARTRAAAGGKTAGLNPQTGEQEQQESGFSETGLPEQASPRREYAAAVAGFLKLIVNPSWWRELATVPPPPFAYASETASGTGMSARAGVESGKQKSAVKKNSPLLAALPVTEAVAATVPEQQTPEEGQPSPPPLRTSDQPAAEPGPPPSTPVTTPPPLPAPATGGPSAQPETAGSRLPVQVPDALPRYRPLPIQAMPSPDVTSSGMRSAEDITQDINRREQEVLMLKQQVDQRLDELKQAETRVQGMLQQAQDVKDEKLNRLVAMYSNMKPKIAAKALESMDERVAVHILMHLTPKQSGDILSYADPEKSAKLTELMTRMQLPE